MGLGAPAVWSRCPLGLVETVTCWRSGAVLGLSHTFVGRRFSTSAMSLKLWPGTSFCPHCHSPLPPRCPHLGAHGSAPKLVLTNVTQLAQSLLCRRGRPPRGGNPQLGQALLGRVFLSEEMRETLSWSLQRPARMGLWKSSVPLRIPSPYVILPSTTRLLQLLSSTLGPSLLGVACALRGCCDACTDAPWRCS